VRALPPNGGGAEKPGKGQSFTRCRVRNLMNNNVVERTWKSGESVELADVDLFFFHQAND